MINAAQLTNDLKPLVLRVEDDLRSRLAEDDSLTQQWKQEHREAMRAERSAASFVAFRDDRITQAAVSWVLTTVFVRFCEDNGLLGPVWIAGPGERAQEAMDAQTAFFRKNPLLTDREWLWQAVRTLKKLPATQGLVEDHVALHLVRPSGDMVTELLAFWRRRGNDGQLVHDFADESLSTRFLGDLYQDLSEYAKKTFALLQTPVFVEEFILDQTLTPALEERPLQGFKLIDPTCGSGHFLLGAFDRFVKLWREQEPGLAPGEVVRRSLSSVYGVDINGFAVAIARFRLTVAALQAMGATSLEQAPEFDLNLAAGDSLLNYDEPMLVLGEQDDLFSFATEDTAALSRILQPRTYDVVVGNPPYITVKDKSLNKTYRALYPKSCKGKYALSAPFMERFFQLAKAVNGPAGWVGQITSNSFMKREFGSRLIEEVLANLDLRLVADTSGAYIPGHGTPTVIIVGRSQVPEGETVRSALGVRGEPGQPADPEQGLVWRQLVKHIDDPGFDGEFVSISDLSRQMLNTHPWSLSGGGAVGALTAVELAGKIRLGGVVESIGFGAITGEDGVFLVDKTVPHAWAWSGLPSRPYVEGEGVRDYSIVGKPALFPYPDETTDTSRWGSGPALWPWRTSLRAGLAFGRTREESGKEWFEYILPNWSRLNANRLISFAFVATHNHFVLDRGGKVFNRSAPVIKLPAEATEDDHLALLGVLNSSTACFWLKQNSYPKGGDPVGKDGARVSQKPWSDRYEFTGTTLQDFPLPNELPLARGRALDRLAQQLSAQQPTVAIGESPTPQLLAQAHAAADRLQAEMIAQQEELDWECYQLYGLTQDSLVFDGEAPGVALGERAFEIVLARKVAAGEADGEWFIRHGSTPITEIPSHWPDDYRALVQRRIDLIESDRSIGLLERPEYKRRWATEPWEKKQEKALRGWLLGRLEKPELWIDQHHRPQPRSVAQLADAVGRDHELVEVLRLWDPRPNISITDSLRKLLVPEAVPYLAAYRLKDSGLRKFEAWKHTWELQRREDAGEKVGTIPVPPKYTSADFKKTDWWQARGKLDVPKERFILYPNANRATDATELLGWAGWDHLQQSLALSTIIGLRQLEGWDDEQLVPLVAGLAELQPWVDQWHSEYNADFGMSLAEFTRGQLDQRSQQVHKTLAELEAWRPPKTTRGRKPRS